MKSRVIGALALFGLAGVLVTAAFARSDGHAQHAASIKIGVSLAGYSTDFWSSYVALKRQPPRSTASRSSARSRRTATRASRRRRSGLSSTRA